MTRLTTDLRAKLALYSIDAVADMIIWTDRDGRYVSVNKAAQRLLGYTAEEFLERTVCDVDPNFDEARWRAHWDDLEQLKSVTLETANVNKRGEVIPIEVTANLVSVDGQMFNCSIVRDISERKRNEAERRGLLERIYQLSITDELTGIANRRRFDEVLEGELADHARSGEPLSLLMLDVDRFKAFNDTYGHLGGDACLRRVAAAISSCMRRATDLAARYGGEEFACILASTGPEGARDLAERLRSAIEGLAIPHAGAAGGYLTISVGGVTCTQARAHSTDSLLSAADEALYRAKREGRNRVVTATL